MLQHFFVERDHANFGDGEVANEEEGVVKTAEITQELETGVSLSGVVRLIVAEEDLHARNFIFLWILSPSADLWLSIVERPKLGRVLKARHVVARVVLKHVLHDFRVNEVWFSFVDLPVLDVQLVHDWSFEVQGVHSLIIVQNHEV